MRFYLSSYKIGNQPEKLAALFSENKNVGYIPNALDFSNADPVRKEEHIKTGMGSLHEIGLNPVVLDLKDYFENPDSLRERLQQLGGIFINGGNVFVLRQAMKLSGLDVLLIKGEVPEDFVYSGYSAGGCVLAPSLKAYAIVDDSKDLPFEKQREVIWEGLGLVPFAFMPHYDSDHPESEDINKEVAYCAEHRIPYKTLRDGQALIITQEGSNIVP